MTTTPHPPGTILTTTDPHPTKPQTHFYQLTHTSQHHYLLQPLTRTTTGTEATMTAIRLARGYTGRDKIIK
ncbi:hypothetical protein, partial [Rothia nasimurium]|uniref:hypothetical protein n=1 Tax=Rothia nasimurium TaxID=85336 RepID=UPI001F1C9009